MNFYLVKTPKFITSFYKNYKWRVPTDKKEIYLTFDDGPTPKITKFVLDSLKKHHAKATFFCIGKNIEKYPELFQRIINEGHTVGNHTQNHLNGWQTNTNKYLNNVALCDHLMTSKLFRPPYGKIKKVQSKELIKNGHEIIMWSVLSGDFDTSISKQKCLQNVVKNTQKGAIIVFHDSIKAMPNLEYALPKVLTFFSDKGFTFGKL